MIKKKTSTKQKFSLDDIQGLDFKTNVLTEFKPEECLKDPREVGEALLQCLIENDTENFISILDSYLRVNRSRIARQADLSRSTVQQALSKTGNPTLKTIAKIVHESVRK